MHTRSKTTHAGRRTAAPVVSTAADTAAATSVATVASARAMFNHRQYEVRARARAMFTQSQYGPAAARIALLHA